MKYLWSLFVSFIFAINIAWAKTEWKDLSELIKKTIADSGLGRHSIDTNYKSKGLLILSGYVASPEDKEIVELRLSRLPGVERIENNLSIKEDIQGVLSEKDKELLNKINKKISEALITEEYKLFLEVRNGNVNLKGYAKDIKTIDKIEQLIKTFSEVKKVNNYLYLMAPISDEELYMKVLGAFNQEDNLQTEDLIINVKNGVVTLSGHKPNHRVVDRILSIVKMVEGVKEIKSDITIGEK